MASPSPHVEVDAVFSRCALCVRGWVCGMGSSDDRSFGRHDAVRRFRFVLPFGAPVVGREDLWGVAYEANRAAGVRFGVPILGASCVLARCGR